ncbi:MAG: hypothetical protein V3W41_22435 [Planctomycetota bacterium]
MGKRLAIEVGQSKKDVAITTQSDPGAGIDLQVTIKDGTTKGEYIRMLQEVKNRLSEETFPPTNT